MKILLCFSLAFICQLESGMVKTPREMKDYLLMEDTYVFTRYHITEWESCMAYDQVMEDHKNITVALWSLLRSARAHMTTITEKIKGGPTENCTVGWKQYFRDLAINENSAYVECLTPFLSEPKRLLISLSKDVTAYKNYKNRTLNRIDHCVKTYTSKENVGKRRNCAMRYFDGFNDKAKVLAEKYKQSKCLKRFEDTLLSCVDISAKNIAVKTAQLLNRLGKCDSVITSQSTRYNPLTAMDYTSRLRNAIKKGMQLYDAMNNQLEIDVQEYFKLFETVLKRSLLEPFGKQYFKNVLTYRARNFYEQTNTSNNMNCGVNAWRKVNNLIEKGSNDYDTCDQRMVEDIKHNLLRLNKMFSGVAVGMPDVGSAVMMSCVSMLGFWVPKSVLNCYTLTVNGFQLIWEPRHELMATISDKINKKVLYYFNHTERPLPCGIQKMAEMRLNIKLTLFDYNRCIRNNNDID